MRFKCFKTIFIIILFVLTLNSCSVGVIKKLDKIMANYEELDGTKTILNNINYDYPKEDFSIPWIEEKLTEKDGNTYVGDKLFCEYPMTLYITKLNHCIYNDRIYTLGLENLETGDKYLCSIDKNFNEYKILKQFKKSASNIRMYILHDGIYFIVSNDDDSIQVYSLFKITENDELFKVDNLPIQGQLKSNYMAPIQLLANDHKSYVFEDCSYFIYENYLYKIYDNVLELCSDKKLIHIKNITKESFSFYYSLKTENMLRLLNEDGTSDVILDYKFMRHSLLAENEIYVINNMIFLFFDESSQTTFRRSIVYDTINEKFYKHTCEIENNYGSDIIIYDDKTFYHKGSNSGYRFTIK